MLDTNTKFQIRDLLSRLRGVKTNGSGWVAFCPSHDDTHRSLSIFHGRDGKEHIHCHAGCPFSSIMDALGVGHNIRFEPAPALAPNPTETPLDCEKILRRCRDDTVTPRLQRLSEKIGISVQSLRRLGACWHDAHQAWAFPMRDGAGNLIGIRLRTESGDKFAVRGSHAGLFIPADLSPDGPIGICEGPTECGAIMDLGFPVIGRPSCSGGIHHITIFLRAHPKREVVIFCNRDQAKTIPGGKTLRPGQDGAMHLAAEIHRPTRIIMPPKHKDFRAWFQEGATRNVVDWLISNTRYVLRGI